MRIACGRSPSATNARIPENTRLASQDPQATPEKEAFDNDYGSND